MLFDPSKHEKLTSTKWNPDRAREKIFEILKDTDEAFRPLEFWPTHPADDEAMPGIPMTSLFNGASSTMWSLLYLQEKGVSVALKNDYVNLFETVYETYLKTPDTDSHAPGYLLGAAGILSVIERFRPTPSHTQMLLSRLFDTSLRPENELMWAAPGALIASKLLYDFSKKDEFLEVITKSAQEILRQWKFDSKLGCHLWTQDLYGRQQQLLGAVHGFAGNVRSLLLAFQHLNSDQKNFTLDKGEETLRITAIIEDGCTSWPPVIGESKRLVQWCHGAPGMITSFAGFPTKTSFELDSLLISAGDLVWRAGPLSKPFGLCHGTAGNGYAFLKLFTRTQDEAWLSRARSFAMHAIEQSDKGFQTFGRHRYEFLTGDLGLCHYLLGCIENDSKWPLIDVI
jgi:lantibiotic modifying enzyme